MSDDLQKKILSRNLLNYLNASKYSQKEVADAIGVSPQTFNTWCQGIALPRMGKLQLLADFFKINKSDLLEEKLPTTCEITTKDENEAKLVRSYRKYNATGKAKLMDYVADLNDSPRNFGEVSDSSTDITEKDDSGSFGRRA